LSYDLIKSIESLIESGRGDTKRLEYIISTLRERKYLYLSDQKYLESLLNSRSIQEGETPKIRKTNEGNDLVDEIRNELKNLNKKLEQIEREKNSVEEKDRQLKPIEHFQNFTLGEKPSKNIYQKRIKCKNEQITLALSIVLGLLGLPGIGLIYLGKIAKGVGILSISFILIALSVYFISSRISQGSFSPLFILNSFEVVLLIGYLGLYIYQIFDARKMCIIYNKYISEEGKPPLWW
jgi:hypothetical protein